MKDAVGFGALNVDLIYRVEDLDSLGKLGQKLAPGSEFFGSAKEFESALSVLSKKGKLISQSGGGQAANTVVALSRMGFSTGYIGKVGRDENGQFLMNGLGSVDTSRIRRDKKSGVCLALLDKFKDRSNLVFPNSNDTLAYQEIDLDYLKDTRFLHLTSFVGERPFKAQKRVAMEAFSTVKISFDPGEIYARRGLKELLPLIKNSFIIFLTDQELAMLVGQDYRQGCQKLLGYGPSIVVCKRGEKGSYVLTAEEEVGIRAQKVRVVDTTGAGDVYAAGFLAGLLLECPLTECVLLATEAAALSVTGYGRENYPDEKFLAQILEEM